ncbi:inorganic diphosphatase [Thalassospira mesophila]|uniref:Inorganic pyrophosphatase n=1 Tax=Thalassospira mesophila TaxID=1293891 RepID=A0A1Y2L4L6_9PROT|nr:inorganic diphosphatase [Thalassospira mesophila]OSQ40423.1 inorganic pyrophosphatase [Thalassospira mesophila]
MDLSKIAVGKDVPWDVNVVIEIPQGGPVKYEVDKDSGALFVDRFLHTSMYYPVNYGFIPNTLGDDGDPVDAMVMFRQPVVAGSVIRARPIGVLMMEDEAGMDEKLICVPHEKVDPYYKDIKSHEDLPEILRDQIQHFFERYKDLEKGKWVKVTGWKGADTAAELINAAIERFAK